MTRQIGATGASITRRRLIAGFAALPLVQGCGVVVRTTPVAAPGILHRSAEADVARFAVSGPLGWLDALALPPDRNYVVLAHVLSAYPVDLSSPFAARRSLENMFLRPASAFFAATGMGHMYLAWHGPDGRGLVSKTGDVAHVGPRMVLQGWGLAPILSRFDDGRLMGPEVRRPRQAGLLAAGFGSVLAVEIARDDLAALRAALADYIAHPARPSQHYGLLLDPDRNEGDGCQSFALWLARQAGVGAELLPVLTRRLDIHEGIIGLLAEAPPGVVPYRAPGDSGVRRVTLSHLRARDWNSGPLIDRVSLVDGELCHALVRGLRHLADPDAPLRSRAGPGMSDPDVVALLAAARPWVARWPVRRIAAPQATSAVVLERG